MSSPDAYDISGGPVTVDFDIVATNITNSAHTIALNFSAHHILTYNGVNVSDGQPGQPGITFSGPAGTTQALMPGSQAFSETWARRAPDPLAHVQVRRLRLLPARRVGAVQAGGNGRDRATLGIRLHPRPRLRDAPTPTPTVTPTPTPASPTGGVGGRDAHPTPPVVSRAITTSTPPLAPAADG